jgi:hypothetical protein
MTDPTDSVGESATMLLERHEETDATEGAASAAADARARRHQGGARSRHRNAGGRRGGHKPTKAELERQVKELLAERQALDDDAVPSGAALPPDQLAEQLVGPLAESIRTASGIVARILRAPWWQLERDECAQLSAAWAPVLAPQLAAHAEKLPVIMAVGVTVEVLMPRVEQQIDAKRKRAAGVEIAPPAKPQEGDSDGRD